MAFIKADTIVRDVLIEMARRRAGSAVAVSEAGTLSGIFTQGDFQQTNNPLDLVVQGRGFFQVRQTSGQEAYTRSGAFHLDRDGNIVDQDGDPMDPQITIPAEAQAVTIASDGTVVSGTPLGAGCAIVANSG